MSGTVAVRSRLSGPSAFLRSDRLLETCSIALVGKYTKFSDSYASVIKALEHSALAINHKLQIKVTFTLTFNALTRCVFTQR